MTKPPTTRKATKAKAPTARIASPATAETSPDIATLASELLRLEPADIVALGGIGAPTVDSVIEKIRAVAGSALRQAGQA